MNPLRNAFAGLFTKTVALPWRQRPSLIPAGSGCRNLALPGHFVNKPPCLPQTFISPPTHDLKILPTEPFST